MLRSRNLSGTLLATSFASTFARLVSTEASKASTGKKPRVVLLGVGWAGFSFLRDLDKSQYELTVISPRNYFLFTPLLPSTTTGTLEFRCIQEPVRTVKGLKYIQAECTGIDLEQKSIHCREVYKGLEFDLPYDKLVIATGAQTNTFGTPGVNEENHVYFLKNLGDARKIRDRLIECFERASNPFLSAEERKRLLTFVVVGGGPTSVEWTAELYDFLKDDVRKWYPDLFDQVTVMLVESSKQILNTFDEKLVAYVKQLFEGRHIHIKTGCRVTSVEGHTVHMSDGARQDFGMAVWNTGLQPLKIIQDAPFEKNRGRVLVDQRLRVLNHPGVYALGDCAVEQDHPMAPLAQVAQQQGRYLAKNLNAGIHWADNSDLSKPFVYRSLGKMAQVGDWKAALDLHGVGEEGKERDLGTFEGLGAFLAWRSAYYTKTVSWANKMLIPMFWFRAWVFGRDISRF